MLQEIVLAHGGTIEASSSPGEGAEFIVFTGFIINGYMISVINHLAIIYFQSLKYCLTICGKILK